MCGKELWTMNNLSHNVPAVVNYAAASPGPVLRQDVILKCAWLVTELNYSPVMPNPVYNIYTVRSNSMVRAKFTIDNMRDVIWPKTDLRAESIPVSMITAGHIYIVTDSAGNTFLAKINSVNPGQSIRLQFLNPGCKDVLLRRADITSVAIVYMRITHSMTDEELDELDQLDNDANQAFIFTSDEIAMMDEYIRYNQQTADDDAALNTLSQIDIPMFNSTQLSPIDMIAEAKNVNTTKERRAQILDAFKRGYNCMQEFHVPAYRVIFLQDADSISVWFD